MKDESLPGYPATIARIAEFRVEFNRILFAAGLASPSGLALRMQSACTGVPETLVAMPVRLRRTVKMGGPMRLLILVALVLGLTPPAAAADAPLAINGAVTVNADGVIALVQTSADLIIVDNRTRSDFDIGHIEGAISLVDSEINEETMLSRIVKSKDTPVLFYCNGVKCGRAANATMKAVSWGYSRVYYYALGLAEWNQRGLPLIR